MKRQTISLIVLLAACFASGCAMGLHPHTTLAGRHFPSERAANVREGQTREDVAASLGEPLEDRATVDGLRKWRYFEEFQPRGCTPVIFGLSVGGRPRWVREVEVTFRGDRVTSVVINNRGGATVD
jgi:outer membrane protein assembly factor BamE (lipoprotein component of BamABCDE complex)